jgi:uncharacterized protein YcfJ
MRKTSVFAALAALTLVPSLVPATASAQDRRTERTYRGADGRYYPCKRSSGTTGAIAGGVGGAVAGNVLGGGVLGTVAGGVGGALLGKHLDKKHDAAQNRKNGC